MVRTPRTEKNGMKKGSWSVEEDNKLRAYIQRYGHWNWRQLPKFAGLSRCGKSCRLRWINYLRPNVKHGNYTKEEDDIIIKFHQELGNKWSVIAARLPGRTDNEIKNHWHTHLKKLAKENQTKSEDQEQSSEISHSEENQKDQSCLNIDLTPENVVEIAPPTSQEASKSFTMFSELYSSESSSFSFDYALLSDIHWASKNSSTLLEPFEEPIGNFWAEPFISDTFCNLNDFSTTYLGDGGFSSSYFK